MILFTTEKARSVPTTVACWLLIALEFSLYAYWFLNWFWHWFFSCVSPVHMWKKNINEINWLIISKTLYSECDSSKLFSNSESATVTFCCTGSPCRPASALMMWPFWKIAPQGSPLSQATSVTLCTGSDNYGQLLLADSDCKIHSDFRNTKMWVNMCL